MKKKVLSIIVMIALCLSLAIGTGAYATTGYSVRGYVEESNYFFAEKGESVQLAALPTSLPVIAEAHSGTIFVEAIPLWRLTDENRESALKGENFTISGTWADHVMQDGAKVYGLNYHQDMAVPTLNVVFVEGGMPQTLKLTLKPLSARGKFMGILFFIDFKEPFGVGMFEQTLLEISDGTGFQSFDISEYITKKPSVTSSLQTQQVDFLGKELCSPNENGEFKDTESLTLQQLKSILEKPHFMRLNANGGIRSGLSNTVHIGNHLLEGMLSPIAEGSVILPPSDSDHGGNRGGVTSFWQSEMGIWLAVIVGVVCAGVCFGGGFLICMMIYRKKKNHE